jgi:RNA polymerase sigma factor (sigma-70 family)
MKKEMSAGFGGQHSEQLSEYLKELEKPQYDVLKKSEELELVKAFKETGDMNARDQLIMHNCRLVPYLIRQYNIYSSDPMDLIQSGNIGLLEALENYNPEKGVRFGTYAVFVIRKYIFGAVSDDLNKVYIPFTMNYLLGKYRQMQELAKKTETELRDKDVMAKLNINHITLKTLKVAANIEYASLSSPIASDDDGKTYVEDIIPDVDAEDMDKNLIAEDNHKLLLEALSKLTPREYDIVIHTFGFECEKQSAKELAEKYGVSNERVYQICKHARAKMKKIFYKNGVYSADV